MIEFHLNARSGVAPYLQLIHQVRHALRLGLLREGDQLPKVKDVAAGLAINPNLMIYGTLYPHGQIVFPTNGAIGGDGAGGVNVGVNL